MSEAFTSPLSGFAELGCVTNDLDRALKMFAAEFGLVGWLETGVVSIDMGNERSGRLRIAILEVDKTLFEIQQPIDGDVEWYREVLPDLEFAVRLHHLGFTRPDDETFEEARNELARHYPIVAEGAFGEGSRYFFADARSTLGHYLEYIRFGPEFTGLIPHFATATTGPSARLAGLAQLAYVTSDYRNALNEISHRYRLSEFAKTGRVTVDIGSTADATLEVAQTYVGGMQFELIAPIAGGVEIYRDVVSAKPDSALVFHHLSFVAPSRTALDTQLSQEILSGNEPVLHGAYGGESAYFYIDARPSLGHYFEYAYAAPAFDALIPGR